MSLTILPPTLVLGLNQQAPFSGAGGVEPYSYAVQGGGAGGTIDPVTGLYKAPAAQGIDTVIVTDSTTPTPQTASATVRVMGVLQLVCDIIQSEMNLDDGQVYLWDQKIDIPTDSKLYIAVGVLTVKPFSNNIRPDTGGSGVNGSQYGNFMATLSIDILSRGPDARDRKEEIILALNSFYAQSQQEANSFHIGKLSTGFVNLSQVDGAAIPYRFNISVNVQYAITKTKAVPYFDDFAVASVNTNP